MPVLSHIYIIIYELPNTSFKWTIPASYVLCEPFYIWNINNFYTVRNM